MIKISNKLFLEDRKTSTMHPQQIHNIQGIDHTLGALLCSNGEVDNLLDEELFLSSKLRSPRPYCLPRYDPYQISILKEVGGISKRN